MIVIDMMGRPPPAGIEEEKRKIPPALGLRDADVKPAFRAVQNAYINLLLNPFYVCDERTPLQMANQSGKTDKIMSKKFIKEIQRIGKAWAPGITSM